MKTRCGCDIGEAKRVYSFTDKHGREVFIHYACANEAQKQKLDEYDADAAAKRKESIEKFKRKFNYGRRIRTIA